MTENEKEEKKIIVDEDWKEEAQREKEILAAQEKAEKEEEHKKKEDEQRQIPPADFSGLISMLATQAFYALGLIRTESNKDKEIEPDMALAKYNIDMLDIIQQKTKGNLSDEEEELLEGTLHQLRMAFVQLSK